MVLTICDSESERTNGRRGHSANKEVMAVAQTGVVISCWGAASSSFSEGGFSYKLQQCVSNMRFTLYSAE